MRVRLAGRTALVFLQGHTDLIALRLCAAQVRGICFRSLDYLVLCFQLCQPKQPQFFSVKSFYYFWPDFIVYSVVSYHKVSQKAITQCNAILQHFCIVIIDASVNHYTPTIQHHTQNSLHKKIASNSGIRMKVTL